jgi:hypothetical protein
MSLMGALALLGAICVAWASYLDVRDKKLAQRRERRAAEDLQ